MAAGRGTNLKLPEQKEILTANRKFIVDYLEADDVIDELIQARVIGENAAQRVQLMGVSRAEKNRGHQLPKKVYGFRNLWISSKDFTDFS